MVEDSIVKKCNDSSISIAGVDMWSATDSDIKRLIDTTHITFPVAKNGISIRNSYSISSSVYVVNIVVIDNDGVVQFVQQFENQMDSTTYKKMVSDAASTVRSLLETGIVRPKATAAFAVRKSSGMQRYYTLSGQTIAHPIPSVGGGIVLRRLDGRVTGFVRFAKPNP
jgi:hypothetical protein